MDMDIEKDCSAYGGLFQQIVNDMKCSAPVWEDFLYKSSKLHTTLRATIMATSAFLDAFQKVADVATGSKGATREIGSALTRLCMRHRSIENKLKAFASILMDVLVSPMQDRMEEWRKNVVQLDKEHTKDYKKARAEIKRASSDTLRLQKKCKKGKPGSDLQVRLDSAMQDANDKYLLLEETEKNAVKNALIEERSRFCFFISCLKPVVDEEISMLTEVTHLQEILQALCMQASDPHLLPPTSEQLIKDVKGSDSQTWTYQTPPSSPSSLGSRKSSMCSISSINSSNSGSTTNSSPSHHFRNRSSSQHLPPGVARLSSVSSQDSGFTSQDTLFMKPPTPPLNFRRKSSLNGSSGSSSGGTEGSGSNPSPSYPSAAVSTWANWPDPPTVSKAEPNQSAAERPHTISSAYEKSHTRPSLTSQTFEPPDPGPVIMNGPHTAATTPSHYAVPCIVPKRGSKTMDIKPPLPGPKPRARPVAPPTVPSDYAAPHMDIPVYVNQDDLAKMAGEMLKGQGRGHDDIPEEEELDDDEDEAMTPTPKTAQRTIQTPAESESASELALAIKELEASTAALELSVGQKESKRNSLQCSSGYGTMNSTPACSEESNLADLDETLTSLDTELMELVEASEKRATLPRNRNSTRSQSFRHTPVSCQAKPVTGVTSPTGSIRRSSSSLSQGQKPPPPIRRNSSIQSNIQDSTTKQFTNNTDAKQHRRSRSDSNSSALSEEGPPHKSSNTASIMAVTSTSSDDSFELPPPPPPEELERDIANATAAAHVAPGSFSNSTAAMHKGSNQNNGAIQTGQTTSVSQMTHIYETAGYKLNSSSNQIDSINVDSPPRSGATLQRQGSIADKHGPIMNSLNDKLSRPTSQPNTNPKVPQTLQPGPTASRHGPPPLAQKPKIRSPTSHSRENDPDITPTAESPTGGSLLAQIENGVKLRKSMCNDRSAPKFA